MSSGVCHTSIKPWGETGPCENLPAEGEQGTEVKEEQAKPSGGSSNEDAKGAATEKIEGVREE